jgi:hypothetical protein
LISHPRDNDLARWRGTPDLKRSAPPQCRHIQLRLPAARVLDLFNWETKPEIRPSGLTSPAGLVSDALEYLDTRQFWLLRLVNTILS